MFNLDLLPTFAVFAETLSFTTTGQHLGLTQPAVHGHVRRLSEQLGERLYTRHGRSLRLTPAGVRLAALARDIVAAREQFLKPQTGLRLAAGRGAWIHLLLPRMGEWLREHAVTPIVATGEEAIRLVLEGTVDLALATHHPPDLEWREVFKVGTHLLLPKNHPATSFAELRGQAWVMPSLGRPHRVAIETILRKAGLQWTVAATSDDWTVTAGFVALGIGVAATNDFVTHPNVRTLPLPEGPVQTYGLLWRRQRPISAVDALRTSYTPT